MAISTFNSAKNILDFYLEKLSEDTENSNAQFAIQYANLHLLRMRAESVLNSIESYDIEYE